MPIFTGNDQIKSPSLGLVKLYTTIVFGASGAVSSQTAEANSGCVVTKNGTGDYRITFSDKWPAFKFLNGLIYNQGTARGQFLELKTKYTSANQYLDIVVVSDAGSAENPTSGDELTLEITMQNKDVGL